MNYLKNYFFDVILCHYADFKGRVNRTCFWFFTLNCIVLYVMSIFLVIFLTSYISYAIYILFLWLLIILPGIAIQVRRLHDINKSAWFIFLPMIPIIGGIIMLILFCLSGTEGTNEYGEPFTKKYE